MILEYGTTLASVEPLVKINYIKGKGQDGKAAIYIVNSD